MTFREAAGFHVRSLARGRPRGETVGELGATDRGLIWLDRLLERAEIDKETLQAVARYLGAPSIRRRLARVMKIDEW